MSALPILRRRRERRIQERQQRADQFNGGLLGVGLTLATLLGVLIVSGAFAYASITADLPSIDLFPILLNPKNGLLLEPTRVYDRNGSLQLAALAPDDSLRRVIPVRPGGVEQLPDSLVRATLALSDPDFWTHSGYTLRGLSDPENHPTLAQKLVSDLLLWNEPPSLRRAFRERILAGQLTARFGREQVLEWYLNSADYGHFAYGAEAAARLYFGKPAAGLTLAESVMLAVTGQSPALNPLDAPQAALERQRAALDFFSRQQTFSADAIAAARNAPLNIQPAQPPAGAAPALVELALSQIQPPALRARAVRGGMRILTTLDDPLQRDAACAVQAQLARLSGAPDPADCPSALLLPALPPGEKPANAASAVVLDPRYGQVLALVGDSRMGDESAFLAGHRPGTLLTPFVYLTGFTRGLSPATLMWDIPPNDSVNGSLESVYHGPVRLRMAMANDYLVPAQNVLDQMSLPAVLQTLRLFGLNVSPAPAGLLASETPLSPLTLASAYGVFATQGVFVHPTALLRIQSLDGQVVFEHAAAQTEQVVSPQLAYLINNVLADQSARWPSQGRPNAFEIGRPVAVKSGLSAETQDAWAVGYTPYRVVVVWMGGQSSSIRPAAGLWAAVMQAASQAQPPDDWPQPEGLVRLYVCDPSGLLPTPACPNRVEEVFLDGYQPVQADTLYQTASINRETGLLATVYTPPQLVEQRVYMVVPPSAQKWAQNAGLPVPPSSYDTLQPPPVNPEVHITTPGMFASLKGKVTIRGTAAGSDFSFYRLQYGQGLNPQTWVLIGSDVKTPVTENVLAEWDTGNLNGLYALQLLVVREDGRIETSTVQVTIANP